MFIRSQDKRVIVNVSDKEVFCLDNHVMVGSRYIGRYKDGKRAEQVMDSIWSWIFHCINGDSELFEMPLD